MNADRLVVELGGIIRRLEDRINRDPHFTEALTAGGEPAVEQLILDSIESAIAGLVVLHIQTRQRFRG